MKTKKLPLKIFLLELILFLFVLSGCESLMLPEREYIGPPPQVNNFAPSQSNIATPGPEGTCMIEIRQSTLTSVFSLYGATKMMEIGSKTGDSSAYGNASACLEYHIYINDKYLGKNYYLGPVPPGWYEVKIVNGLTNGIVFHKSYYINPGEKVNVFY